MHGILDPILQRLLVDLSAQQLLQNQLAGVSEMDSKITECCMHSKLAFGRSWGQHTSQSRLKWVPKQFPKFRFATPRSLLQGSGELLEPTKAPEPLKSDFGTTLGQNMPQNQQKIHQRIPKKCFKAGRKSLETHCLTNCGQQIR